MSGHNPHGRVGGHPVNSSSWNHHLQVPSYVPRQPQLAHMSSERSTMRSSPSIWSSPSASHTASVNQADALYGYMAAAAAAAAAAANSSNHKANPLDMNPLLPFVRSASNAMPFGSVDLSITSSTARNSLTPSPRSQLSPVISGGNNKIHHPPSNVSHNHTSSISMAHSNSNAKSTSTMDSDVESESGGMTNDCNPESINSIDSRLAADSISYLSDIADKMASMKQHGATNPMVAALLARSTHNLNNDLLSSNYPSINNDDMSKARDHDEPMELIKDSNSANSYENDNLNPALPLQQLFGLNSAASAAGIPPNLSEISTILSLISNASQPSSLMIPPMLSAAAGFHAQNQSFASKNTSHTSNDDSLDSQSGPCNNGDDACVEQKTKRRRKPQKTIRVSKDRQAQALNLPMPVAAMKSNDNGIASDDKLNESVNETNGLNLPMFNSGLSNASAVQAPPQTQSMDLSNHCGVHEINTNGFVNNKSSEAFKTASSTLSEVNANGFPSTRMGSTGNEINGLNLFPSMNFNHITGSNSISNDIGTFPNTDDLVKKVEELVKCNERNGFSDDFFNRSAGLGKSHEDKSNAKTHDENGIGENVTHTIPNATTKNLDDSELLKIDNDLPAAVKCNGNRIIDTKKPNLSRKREEGRLENGDEQSVLPMAEAKIPDAMPFVNSTPKADGKSKEIDDDDNKILRKTFSDREDHNETSIEPVTNYSTEISADEANATKEADRTNAGDQNESNTSKNCKNDTQQTNGTSSGNSNDKNIASDNRSEERAENIPTTTSSESTPSKPQAAKRKAAAKKSNVKNTNNSNSKSNGKMNKRRRNSSSARKIIKKNTKTRDKSEKNEKKAKAKEEASSEALNRFRGPFVRVDKDGSEVVINAPIAEEVAEKLGKFKKNYVSQTAIDRNKIRGLHVSTLSNKYDADTTDASWMCVFCKLGPHKYGLGDLFGPFILLTESEEFQLAQIDPSEDVFRSHRTKADMVQSKNVLVVQAKVTSLKSATSGGSSTTKKKRKLNEGNSENITTSTASTSSAPFNGLDIFYGMTKASENAYEVWSHEDCIVWSSGVHIIGARVVGLDAAVWSSSRHLCSVCQQYGAVLSCLQRNCSDEVHVPCAKRSEWSLDEHTFQSRCAKHRLTDGDTSDEDADDNDD